MITALKSASSSGNQHPFNSHILTHIKISLCSNAHERSRLANPLHSRPFAKSAPPTSSRKIMTHSIPHFQPARLLLNPPNPPNSSCNLYAKVNPGGTAYLHSLLASPNPTPPSTHPIAAASAPPAPPLARRLPLNAGLHCCESQRWPSLR